MSRSDILRYYLGLCTYEPTYVLATPVILHRLFVCEIILAALEASWSSCHAIKLMIVKFHISNMKLPEPFLTI